MHYPLHVDLGKFILLKTRKISYLMQVYLDNAATTPLDPVVLEAMQPYVTMLYGNPSSVHSHGRAAKVAIEKARKQIAELLHCAPLEIFFTSGGTEANNMALHGSVDSHGIKHVITSPIEHHAVLQPLEVLKKANRIQIHFVQLDKKGHIQYDHLVQLLQQHSQVLVSLMHVNNEVGNINDIARIGELCKTYGAIFHSDTVQALDNFRYDLQALPIDFLTGSAHKIHGPKGIGLIYIRSGIKINPLIYGGAQERNMRGGTENVPNIIGFAKALEIAYSDSIKNQAHIQNLKQRMMEGLKKNIPNIAFNGDSDHPKKSLPSILNVSCPPSEDHDMLLLKLDIQKISASEGSACTSGNTLRSHVLEALHTASGRGAVRFSFSKYNTIEEIDHTVAQLTELCRVQVLA